MGKIDKLIEQLIPSAASMQGDIFVDKSTIDSLTPDTRTSLEQRLLERLESEFDVLIVETLIYMKSERVIKTLLNQLDQSDKADLTKIMLCSYLFELGSGSKEIEEIAYSSFLALKEKYALISMFYYLVKIKSDRINARIRDFTDSSDLLLAHNSRSALRMVD